ncbi:MAG: carboxypeptidase regulatory-like domain-containing protein [Bryobacteraceae bacterium]
MIFLAFGCQFLRAQATFGTIYGTVTDPAGSPVPAVKLTITSLDRGINYSTTTNETGNYTQTHLTVGLYTVEMEAKGFQRHVQREVRVSADRSTRVDMTLTIGQVTEQIFVTGSTPALVTDRAEVSTSLDAKQVRDLPTLNRNLTQLQLLMPGAQKVLGQHASSENPQAGLQINNNGQNFGATNFMIDGTDNNDPVLGIIIVNPAIDSVQEYKYTTGNYDAEFAQAGGAVIQVETKSGTNRNHGSLFEFLRNNNFNARNPFSEPNGPPQLKWNQFGGSLGGPIVKNKLFAFGDYQGSRQRTGASLLTTTATQAVRDGDFSAFGVPIYDPSSGDANGAGRTQFTGNRIPANRISPQAANLLKLLPLPNTGAAGAFNNNYNASGSEQFDTNQFDIKVDHHVTDSLHYFSRYSYAGFLKISPPAFGIAAGGPGLSGLLFAGESNTRNQNWVWGFNKTMNPTLITDFRFGYSRYRVNVLPLDFGATPAADAGIPNVNISGRPDTSGMPSFVVDGNGGFRMGFSLPVNQCNCPLNQREFVLQFINNWTKISGNHTVKWGTDVRRAQNLRVASDTKRNGNWNFGPTVTGLAGVANSGLGPATFLLGLPSGFGRYFQNTGDTNPEDLQWRMFYFVQDTWRVTPKLTLSLGIRWDTWFPNQSVNPGQGSRYDVTTNNFVIAGIGGNSKSAGVLTEWKNFSPRFSIAYQVTPKMVVRTGWGRSFFQEIFGNTFNNTANGYPTFVTQTPSQVNPATPLFSFAQGPPSISLPAVPQNGLLQLPDRIGATYRPVDSRYSYVDSWNFSIERLIGNDTTATASYVGNVGRHLRIGWALNQAIPGPGALNPRRPLFVKYGLTQGISDASNMANNLYQALQTKLTRRFSNDLSMLVTYTWSKSLDYAGGLMVNGRLNRGIADFDRAHVLTLGHNYTLPFGPGKRFFSEASGVARRIAEGWEFSGVSLVNSGLAITPTLVSNAAINSDVAGVSLRPDRVTGVDPYDVAGGQSRNQWFNLAAYRVPGLYQFGTSSRGQLRGPGLVELNYSLSKRFGLGEAKSLQLRWEVFNAINRTNLANPNTAIDSGAAAAARITGLVVTGTMRQMQLGARIEF